jgi:SNF2 family DNA or RNA helicase
MRFKKKPYDWQMKAISMAENVDEFALLADMGTGKTGALINILRTKYAKEGRLMRTLIISPLVTLFNWKNEFAKHSYIEPSRIHPLYGTTDQKIKKFHKAVDFDNSAILAVNYEAFISPKFVDIIAKWGVEVLVLDESHNCKNYQAKRSKTIFALSLDTKYRYIMTGTPMTNDIPDLFMQYKILDHGKTFGSNFFVFRRKYMMDENEAWDHLQKHFPKWVVNPAKIEEVNQLVYKKAIRVTKDETLDLPKLVNEIIPVPLSKSQEKYYNQMRDDYLTYVEEGEAKGIAVAQMAMTKALRLQQIVTGFITDEEGQIIEIKDNPRLKVVDELITALHVNHKVIIWCSFKHNYKQLGKLMEKLKVEHTFITGDMNLEQKRDAMDSFNDDPKTRVIICNRKAAGVGINLVSAAYSIVYSRNFSLEEELQSRDRNYRGGSEIHDRIVRINLSAIGTVDERVTEALVNKKKVSDQVLHYVKGE